MLITLRLARWPQALAALSRCALLLLSLPLVAAEREEEVIRHSPAPAGDRLLHAYYVDLLDLALEKTRRDHGPYRLQALSAAPSQTRMLRLLGENRQLDVGWGMTTVEREAQARPVRIPLFKGLMGYRLLLVREADSAFFGQIRTLSQLRHLTAGQAHDWADVAILRANRLPVMTSSHYFPLFAMLGRGRFDYFPRGVTEAFVELREHDNGILTVAPDIALHYPTAMYFFVSPDNTALAQRLETGLRRALADGSFDRLLHNHPGTAGGLRQARLPQRHVIELKNPYLPPQTPLDEHELWHFPPQPAGSP